MMRFPEHREFIGRLYRTSESFQTLCDDYRECLGLHQSCSDSIAQEAAAYREDLALLQSELEEEILEYVEREDELIDPEF